INVLNASAGVQYTCLLTNRAPGSLTYNDIRTDRSTVALVKPLSGTIDTITISWQNLAPNTLTDTFCNTDPGVFPFPTNNQWSNSPYNCDVGIIRADILPGTAFNRAALNCNAMTAFLYPISTPPATPLSYHDCNFTPPASGAITSGACDLTHTPYCSVKISFPAENQVYLRLKSIYLDSSVSITACSSPCSSNASLTGDQLLVDATGKANDVLRRIQVRVPISPSGPFPEFALLSGDSICKRLQIDPTTGTATNAGPPGIEACNVLNP
ncbi:MAG TPA: hypothetical protein VLE74_00845, partial [Candidatus Saccharimonadales bacterium]|nr:hypothetical protein [Candidatus Saccharimonadales bacterium]